MIGPVGIAVFICIMLVTFFITRWAGKKTNSVDDHLVAGGKIGARQNGFAIVGDAVSASTFLGTVGAVALLGINGSFLSMFVPIAFTLAMLFVAEPLRNLGKLTLADVGAVRFPSNGVRLTMASCSATISVIYTVAQYVAGALLLNLLFGIEYWIGIGATAILTSIYVLFGGMLAATWIQIVKSFLLLVSVTTLVLLVLSHFGWSLGELFRSTEQIEEGALLVPEQRGSVYAVDQLSAAVGSILGFIGLPHVLIRFLTVKDAKSARTSAITSIWMVSAILMTFPIIAYGAATLVGAKTITGAAKSGNLTVPLLADYVGGDALLGFVSAVAVATILASLAGMTLATTGAVAHDIYGQIIKSGSATPGAELRVVRITTVAVGAIATLIAFAVRDQNLTVLALLAIALAGSASFPALMSIIYAKRITGAGVASGMIVGLVSALTMIILSPTISGPDALVPLVNPGIVSIPLAAITIMVVSWFTRPTGEQRVVADETYAAMRVKALTGRDVAPVKGAPAIPPHAGEVGSMHSLGGGPV